MFFGLTNSPATFQKMMNHIFCPSIAKHKLFGTSIHVYIDNIAITTHINNQNHTMVICDVLTLATKHDLYFKLKKCLFYVPSIDCLRVILEKGVTHMNPVKIAGIKNWPTSEKVKDIRSFLGLQFLLCLYQGFCVHCMPTQLTNQEGSGMAMVY